MEKLEDDNVSLDFTGLSLDFESIKRTVLREFKTYYTSNNTGRKYSKEQVRRFLENPQQYERQIREVSLYLASSSSHYLRLVLYLSTMLTLDNLVIPINAGKEIKGKGFLAQYTKALAYMDKFNVKHELSKIIPTIIIEDTFYGYESLVGGTSTIRRLPNNYCKIIGVEDGVFIFAFNFGYFNGKEELINSFPREFKRLYNVYLKTGIAWQELDPNKGAVCFKFRDDLTYSLPLLAPLFEEVMELEEKKDRENLKEELENFKLLVQKIPFKDDPKSEKDFLLSLDSVKMFHNNIKSSLPKNVGLISTPMDIGDYSFERKAGSDKSNVPLAQDTLFTSAGFGNIFSSQNKTKTAQDNANTSDQSMMFKLLRQFERFFNKRLAHNLDKKYPMQVMFPDVTYFNRDAEVNKYLKMAQFGFPKSLVAVTMGMSQSQFLGLNALENSILELESKLVPLNSSHTQNGASSPSSKNGEGATDEGGRPTSDQIKVEQRVEKKTEVKGDSADNK